MAGTAIISSIFIFVLLFDYALKLNVLRRFPVINQMIIEISALVLLIILLTLMGVPAKTIAIVIGVILLFYFLGAGIIIIIGWLLSRIRVPPEIKTDRTGVSGKGLVDILATRFGDHSILVIIGVALLLMTSMAVGMGNAARKTEFYVLDHTEDYLLVRSYGDAIIFARFNREDALIFRSYLIMPSATDTLSFRRERLGNLRLKPTE